MVKLITNNNQREFWISILVCVYDNLRLIEPKKEHPFSLGTSLNHSHHVKMS